MDVADLLIGELEEFVSRAPESGGGKRLECLPQLILLRPPAAGRKQPSSGEAGRQGDHNTEREFQFLQFSLEPAVAIRFT